MSKKRKRKDQQQRLQKQKKQAKRKRAARRSTARPQPASVKPAPERRGALSRLLQRLSGGKATDPQLLRLAGVRVGEPVPLPSDFPPIAADIRAYGEQQRARLSPAEREAAMVRHYKAGRQAFEREQYQRAIPEFQRAIVLMTEDMAGPEAFFNLAQSYANLDQVEAYRAVMTFYLKIVPGDPDAYFSLAYAALMEEDYEECIRLSKLGRARVRGPDPRGLINLARAYQHLGRYKESVATLEEAIRIDPTRSEAYQCLGAWYEDQMKLDQAKKYYRRAVEVDPANRAAQRNLERLEQGIVVLGGPPPPWLSADIGEE